MQSICVFTGSSPGARSEYRAAAEALGATLARRGVRLIYGGANVGLMGAVADSALAAGGEVIGVIPEGLLAKEVAHHGLSELRVVESMHERKAFMAELSDGIVALPGGLGTLEEFFEMLTWSQLGLHRKACGLLNIAGYYDRLLQFLDHGVAERFIAAEHRGMLLDDSNAERLLERMTTYSAPTIGKWLDRETR